MSYAKQTILFGAPTNFGFSDAIKSELTNLGYCVIDFSTIGGIPFRYKSIYQRLYNCYRKVFFNDYEFKKFLRLKANEEYMISILDTIPACDYGLFIRPDFFPINFLEKVKTKVGSIVGYQWDGLSRFPAINEYIPLFDRFFVFDSQDLDQPNTLPTTNFYFDSLKNTPAPAVQQEAYFIGSYIGERMPQIVGLRDQLLRNGLQDNIILYSNRSKGTKDILKHGFQHIPEYIHYKDNMKNSMKASVLIDIHNPIHNGLTFRTFESLGFEKKLITSNKEVAHYDFYNADNIFIWDQESTSELKDFLSCPYTSIDEDIQEKYSFSNWIKYILNSDEHIPIALPQMQQKKESMFDYA